MNITLWIVQAVLAAFFAASGIAKSTMTRERMLDSGQTGIAMFPMGVVRFAGTMELLAAVGLIAPRLTGIATPLTPAAATGLCAVMLGAAWAHVRLHEPAGVAFVAILFSLAAFVAIGRL